MSKKLIGIIASFALVLSVVAVNSASALTAADVAMLQAAGIISASQAASLNASLAPAAAVSSGYNFAKDLTVGSRGADVTALQNMLGVSPATGYFGSLTKAALIKYQLSKGISPAAGYFGPKTRGVVNASSPVVSNPSGPVVNANGTDLSVSLAPTSPVTGAVVAGQAIANLAEFTFTNKSATPALVTNVTLQRGGVSNDAVLTNVYLYNGVNRLTDSASISAGKVTFNAPTGLFTVPAGSSMTVAVRSDIVSGTSYNGQILVLSLTGVTSNLPVSAMYPVSGASQTVSSATLSSVTLSASSTPTTTSMDPQTDFVMWQQSVSIGTNDVWMKSLALRQIGSVAAGDLGNFRFYVDGAQVGPTLSTFDSNGYLTFDLSANPNKLTTGSHTLKLVGDIIGGSTRTFSFSLRQASDINVVDSQLNINVSAVTGAGASFSNNDTTTGTISVNSGSITVTKKTDSPSGNVTLTASGVTLARFEVKAAGEAMKVENLYVRMAPSIVTVGSVRNGALYANGAQIGSSADISSSTAGTVFNLGSSLVVYPGAPVVLEVRGDVYDNVGTQNFVNGTTFTVSLVAGSSNVQRLKSLSYTNTSAVSANTMTVSQGSLSLSKQGSYANQSVVAPQTAMKLGSYTLTAGTTEDLNLNTIVVNFGSASTSDSQITDVYVVYGPRTTSNKSTISTTTDNSYSVNYTLAKGQTIDVTVYGTLASSIGASDTVVTKLSIVGQTALSSQTVTIPATSYTTGQTVSITTGVLTPAVYTLAASSTVVAGNLVKAGSFQFIATGDTFTVDQLIGYVPFASAGNVASVVYKIGGTTLNPGGTSIDTSDASTATATTTGLNIVVPANSSNGVIVDAYLQLASVGTPGAATSSSNVLFTLTGFRKMTSTGIQTNVGGSALAGNVQYAYASVPTITNMDLPESGATSLVAGTKTLARFKVSADAAGAIDWKMIKFYITKPAAVNLGSSTASLGDWSLTDDSGNVIAGAMASTTGALDLAATAGDIAFTATSPETISAGSYKVYRLKTTVNGVIATNDAVTSKIKVGTAGHIQSTTASAAATNATFTWSDRSYAPHSPTTPDWNNDVLVKQIPTDSQQIIN